MSSIERAMDKVVDGRPAATSVAESAPVNPAEAAHPPALLTDSEPPSAVPVTAAPGLTPAARPASPASEARARHGSEPVLTGNILNIDFARLAAGSFLTPDQPMTRQSEEFQQIKRRLLGNLLPGALPENRPANLILITSSVPGEGKTFNSVNLAISIAMEVDHTVLVIDTDIMKRDLSRVFGVNDRKGLYDFLAAPATRLEDLLVRTNMPNLVVLPVGTKREGSSELLASMRMRELADEIAERYQDRVVIFDSPPVLATTTAAALAPMVGQIVLVAEAGSTKHETIRDALQRLDRFVITGVILNKSKQETTSSYDYYGSYYRAQ